MTRGVSRVRRRRATATPRALTPTLTRALTPNRRPACIGFANLPDAHHRLSSLPSLQVFSLGLSRACRTSWLPSLRRRRAILVGTAMAGAVARAVTRPVPPEHGPRAWAVPGRLAVSGATLGPWICRCKRVHNPNHNDGTGTPFGPAEPAGRGVASARVRRGARAGARQARPHRAARQPRPRRDRVRPRTGASRPAHGRRPDDHRVLPRGEPPREPGPREAPRARAAEDQDGARG